MAAKTDQGTTLLLVGGLIAIAVWWANRQPAQAAPGFGPVVEQETTGVYYPPSIMQDVFL